MFSPFTTLVSTILLLAPPVGSPVSLRNRGDARWRDFKHLVRFHGRFVLSSFFVSSGRNVNRSISDRILYACLLPQTILSKRCIFCPMSCFVRKGIGIDAAGRQAAEPRGPHQAWSIIRDSLHGVKNFTTNYYKLLPNSR
jgi:hypothetical protein